MLNLGESFIIVNLIHADRKIKERKLTEFILSYLTRLFVVESEDESETNQNIESFRIEPVDELPKIRLKIFGGPRSGEVFYFKPEDCDEIKIGRSPQCNIKIDDEVLSKFQCHIYFDFNLHTWFLEDGGKQKASTNGTWLYLNEEFPIYDNMTFKAHQTVFNVNFLK